MAKSSKNPKIKKVEPMPLSGSFRLTRKAVNLLARHWKLFGGIALIYAFLSLIFVQGLSSSNISDLKTTLEGGLGGNQEKLFSSLLLFSYIIGSSTNPTTETSSVYRFILTLMTSLALIWALRQVLAGKTVRIRDSFYEGMYPLVPFFLVFTVVTLELLPVSAGTYLYGFAVQAGMTNGFDHLIWIALALALAAVSIFLLCSSLFALYIVCLPAARPLPALRSAWALVRGRRLLIVRRLLFLPLAMLLISAVIMLPVIAWATPLSPWVFFVLSVLALIFLHSYMYTMYRELLHAR